MPNNDEDDGDDILQRWSRERDDLKRLLVLQNTEGWQVERKKHRMIFFCVCKIPVRTVRTWRGSPGLAE